MKWLTALLLLPITLFGTNGFYQIGYGTQSKGMGGATVALPQDSLVVATNPAGLSALRNRFDVGADWLNERGSTGDLKTNEDLFFPELGIVRHLPCRLTAGVAFYRTGVLETSYPEPIPFYGTTPPGITFDQYAITPSLAWAINCCHSIGISVDITYNRFKANGIQFAELASLYPNDVTNRGAEDEWGFNIRVGWLGHFKNCFSLGASFQTPTWSQKFGRYRGLTPNAGDLDMPANFWLGGSYYLPCRLVFAADLGYYFWEGQPFFGNRNDTGKPNGSANGPGFGWRDQLVIRVGTAYSFLPCWTARLGYNFGQSVVKDSQLISNGLILPLIQHHVTAGLTCNWLCNEFSVAYIHGFCKTRRSLTTFSAEQDQVSISWGRTF